MKQTEVILKKLYPKVATNTAKNMNKIKACISRFIEKRSKELYDIAPCDRIYFGADDLDDFYKSIGMNEKEIRDILEETYYYPMANFNPRAAKDEFTVAVLCMIRYFFLQKKHKETELVCIYLAFSGSFYPSIHYGSFPKVQPSEYRHIMEYVVNNELSNRFDIKSEGSVFGAVKSICLTWLNSYDDMLKDFDDEDVVYLIQQLHNRIKSFMKNIAEVYYDIYDKKDSYLTYDGDNLDEDNYHMADSDSLRIERSVEKTMSYINSTTVDYTICKMAAKDEISPQETKGIIEAILSNNENMSEVKELIRLIISNYFAESKKKDLRDIEFISLSITPKPNSKNTDVIRQKDIVETWLDENSERYRRRKGRPATRSAYNKSITSYFVLLIHNSNK